MHLTDYGNNIISRRPPKCLWWLQLIIIHLLFLCPTSYSQVKIIIPKYKCSTHTSESELYRSIKGCTRLDSAYNRIVHYFIEANGDFFLLVCNSGCIPPLRKEFPLNTGGKHLPTMVPGMGTTSLDTWKIPIYFVIDQHLLDTSWNELDTATRYLIRTMEKEPGFAVIHREKKLESDMLITDAPDAALLPSHDGYTIWEHKLQPSTHDFYSHSGPNLGKYEIDIIDNATKQLLDIHTFFTTLKEIDLPTISQPYHKTSITEWKNLHSLGNYTITYLQWYAIPQERDSLVEVKIALKAKNKSLEATLQQKLLEIQPVVAVDRVSSDTLQLTVACSRECLLQMLRQSFLGQQMNITPTGKETISLKTTMKH